MDQPTTSPSPAAPTNPSPAPPERAMTMSEPPSYSATVAASAPHRHANAMEQGLADTTPLDSLQAKPAMIVCPYCYQRGMTRVDARNTGAAFAVACLLCFVCIIAALLPFLFRWFQDKHHYCSHCGKEVAVRHSNGGIEVHKELPKYAHSGNGDAYPMVNMGAAAPSPVMGAQRAMEQGGQRDEQQISSFLATNAPRERDGERRG